MYSMRTRWAEVLKARNTQGHWRFSGKVLTLNTWKRRNSLPRCERWWKNVISSVFEQIWIDLWVLDNALIREEAIANMGRPHRCTVRTLDKWTWKNSKEGTSILMDKGSSRLDGEEVLVALWILDDQDYLIRFVRRYLGVFFLVVLYITSCFHFLLQQPFGYNWSMAFGRWRGTQSRLYLGMENCLSTVYSEYVYCCNTACGYSCQSVSGAE